MEKRDVSIFIITKNGQYIYVNDYEKKEDGNGMFVMLTNDELNSDYGDNNSIIIHKDWKKISKKAFFEYFNGNVDANVTKEYIEIPWQSKNKEIPNNPKIKNDEFDTLQKDFDGYSHCKNIILNVPYSIDDMLINWWIPAIMLAYRTEVDFRNKTYHGYLPSMGQLLYVSDNVEDINNAFIKCTATTRRMFPIDTNYTKNYKYRPSFFVLKGYWWSSTEKDALFTWALRDIHSSLLPFCALSKMGWEETYTLPLYALDI